MNARAILLWALALGPEQLDVFVRGNDGGVWSKYWNASAGWSGWFSLGSGGGANNSAPEAVSRADNRLDLYARGGDGAVWANTWDGSGWGGWYSLGAP
jgi:hypothetical protein